MRKWFSISLIAILLIFTLSPNVLADDKIHFAINPTTFEGEVGDTIIIPVGIQSLPDGFNSSIITFGLVVNYDPAYLNVEGVSHGTVGLAGDFDSNYALDPSNFNNQAGQVIISYSTTGSGISQAGSFYNISFKLKAKPSNGATNISLAQRTSPAGTPYDSTYKSYTAAYAGAVITITEQVTEDNTIHFQANPATINAQVDDTITVPVSIQSLPTGLNTSIIAFGLILSYNPAYLQLMGVSPGTIGQAEDFDSSYSLDPTGFDHTKGKLTISYATTGAGITQIGTFYNVSFKILAQPAAGSTEITLAQRTSPDGTAFDSQQNTYIGAYQNGTISIDNAIDECFIATASFGSRFEPSVVLLRQFRDQYLLTNTPGQAFVKFYYKNSPPIAAFIAQNESLKVIVRGILTPVVGVVYLFMHPLGAIMVLLIIFALWNLRTRTRMQ